MEMGFSERRIAEREAEIRQVADHFGFSSVNRLGFPTTCLDRIAQGELIGKVSAVIHAVEPEILYLPYRGDAHSDHAALYDACAACTKWFRHPSVKAVRLYETPSETDSALVTDGRPFQPNLFIDISAWLEAKIAAMRIYANEMGEPPFPRSEPVLRAHATIRGSQAGCMAAEAFMSVKEVLA